MLWSRTFGAIFLFLVGASGCGYQPLYGGSKGDEVVSELSQIKVATIEDRVGQKLHNYLLDRITPDGRPSSPKYLLTVRAQLTTTELGLLFTEIATRAQLTLQASFTLSDLGTGEVLANGFARSVNSYNIPDSEYAKVTAEKDATDRATREVSDDIKTRLALYFRK